MSDSIKRVIIAVLILLGILFAGTVGFSYFEGWNFLDSLWMTVITMSTVGFNEVHPLHTVSRVLAMFVIGCTLLVGGYAIGNISAFLIEGEMGDLLKGHKMERKIGRLKDHVILTGFGLVGHEAAKAWDRENLVVIEKNENRYENAVEHGFKAIQGDATQDEILEKAGIKAAHGIILATGVVAETILISLTAREMNPSIIISARIDDIHAVSKLRKIGVEHIVTPSVIGGKRLAASIEHPAIVDFLDLVMKRDDLSLKLEELKLESGCSLDGKTQIESDIRKNTGGALVMSIRKDNGKYVVSPQPDHRLHGGDTLILLGTDDALEKAVDLGIV